MKVIFHDPYPPKPEVVEKFQATACDSVEEVLEKADFVSLHCPGGESTYHLINDERLARMKSSAILVNSARGDIIDNQALIKALKNGIIAGAGLDVFEGEPKLDPGFLELENAVLVPHLGSASTETRIAMGMRVVENLDLFFADQEPRDQRRLSTRPGTGPACMPSDVAASADRPEDRIRADTLRYNRKYGSATGRAAAGSHPPPHPGNCPASLKAEGR